LAFLKLFCNCFDGLSVAAISFDRTFNFCLASRYAILASLVALDEFLKASIWFALSVTFFIAEPNDYNCLFADPKAPLNDLPSSAPIKTETDALVAGIILLNFVSFFLY